MDIKKTKLPDTGRKIVKPETSPKPPTEDAQPPKEEKGDSVILKGLAGAGKFLVGAAGFTIGGTVGGIKGMWKGASADEPKKPSDSIETKPSKGKSFLRKLGAAAGMAVGVGLGLAFAPAGLTALAVTVVTAAAGGAVGASAPEIAPRFVNSLAEGVKGIKDGGVAGWNVARSPFESKEKKDGEAEKAPPTSQPPTE